MGCAQSSLSNNVFSVFMMSKSGSSLRCQPYKDINRNFKKHFTPKTFFFPKLKSGAVAYKTYIQKILLNSHRRHTTTNLFLRKRVTALPLQLPHFQYKPIQKQYKHKPSRGQHF